MDLGIEGKRALVLSSSRGLGRGIAAALAQEGAEVVLTGRDEEALGETAGWIAANGGKVHVCPANLSAEDFATALADAAASAMGGVDILVNNTGGPPPGTAQAITAQSVAAQAQMMVGNVIALTGLLLPGMAERGWGRVLVWRRAADPQPGAVQHAARCAGRLEQDAGQRGCRSGHYLQHPHPWAYSYRPCRSTRCCRG
jgi:3-oxoacyl-[acyl-carrier protein] reductase